MYLLNETEEFLCAAIIDCAYCVHPEPGPGLLEKIYETCICYELEKREKVNPVWQAQMLSHIKLSKVHVGFVINFNVGAIKDGIRRYCVE